MKPPKWITQLFDNGSAPYSLVTSQSDRYLFSELQSLHLVKIEVRKTKRKINVIEKDQFSHWMEAKYPVTVSQSEQLRTRAQNIVSRRDSKSGKTAHSTQPVILKWFGTDLSSEYLHLTVQYGIFGIISEQIHFMQLPEKWWLLTVENWESFYSLTYPEITTTLIAVYLGGNVSDIVLQALSSLRPSPECILHFGDYDWTGLTIFQRVQAILSHAKLYAPHNIGKLLQHYGNQYFGQFLRVETPYFQGILERI